MNAKLESLLTEAKRKEQEAEQKQRDEHLISLGLTDDNKIQKNYIDYFDLYAKSDDKGNYYITYGAIDVTDEEYAEICKFYPLHNESPEDQIIRQIGENVSTIKKIMVFFTILWVVGILLSIIILIANA